MAGIERDNPSLKGVLPKEYARPALDKQRLGQLIDLISNIRIGDTESRAKDVLGRVYEYFLSQFASAEGKKGGEFYTPRSVVKLLVEMIEPYNGRVYDPCCGSSGMFVQSIEFIQAHKSGNGNGGKAKSDISIYGQESNYTTWRLAKMNLALRGITIDWTMRENVRAQLRVIVKRILRKYGYPPDKQEKATQTVLEQVELLGWETAA
jgi:type I restriction enzyme M protein